MLLQRLTILASMMLVAWASLPTGNAVLPDTDCSETTVNPANNLDYAAGVGAPSGAGPNAWVNPPHVYTSGVDFFLYSMDTCTNYGGLGDPTLVSGEFGFGVGGAHLFARAGANIAGDGEGTVGCYGAFTTTGGHHGPHTEVFVLDDVLGGAVGFSMTADWNRTVSNLGTGNNAGIADCGDGLVEPCDPPTYTEPACNDLDHVRASVWPEFSDLGTFAGADGTVLVYVSVDSRNGAIWTS